MLNEEQKQKLQKAGFSAAKITAFEAQRAARTPLEQQPSYLQRVGTQFQNAGNRIQEGVESGANAIEQGLTREEGVSPEKKGLNTILGAARAGLRTVGSVVGAAFAPITEAPGVKKATQFAAENVTKIPGAEQLLSKASELSQRYPEAAKDIEDLVNIATLGGGTVAEQVTKDSATTAGKSIGNTVTRGLDNAAELVGRGASEEGFIRELVTPDLNTKGIAAAIRTGKVQENTTLGGSRNISNAISNINQIEEAVKKVPGISRKNTNLQNANLIHDRIGNVATSLEDGLTLAQTQIGKDRGFFTPNQFTSYMKTVKNELTDNPLIVGNAETTANKILIKFETLVSKNGYKPTGLLKARKELDNWIRTQKGDKVFSPDTDNAVSLALKGIRQGGNNFLAKLVPDVEVKTLLREQANLYNALDNIANKAAREGGNKVERFTKNNPKTTQLIKYGATATGGGLIADQVLN